MDILVNNPLANMVGPYFLVFYGALLVIFLMLAYSTAKSIDSSGRLPPLSVPENPNPYEIAYLRGGADEVVQLMVVELFQRGILVEAPKSPWQRIKFQLSDAVDLNSLDPALRQLAERFTEPRDLATIKAHSLQGLLGAQLEHWSKWISDEQLMFDPAQRSGLRRYGLLLMSVFVAVGGYKFAVALSKHHYNVAFLCMVALIGSIAILAVVRLPTYTARGRRYLQDLRTAYASLKMNELPKPEEYQPAANSAAWDPLLVGAYAMPVMAMGLFGASALQSAHYRSLRERFNSSGSSCGAASGCGTGCNAASGADGGGAGCGGGGGGGCGGGCGGCGS